MITGGMSLYTYERALHRAGLGPVAGVDEAGRGACAGPLVVAAVVLPPGRRGLVPELADSKLLTATTRERVYSRVVATAESWHCVVIPTGEVDEDGVHRANIAGMRRAVLGLDQLPGYVLTDGFAVGGLGTPALAVCKGDRTAACIAAASVVAKVTRDRIMMELDRRWPTYGFAAHKGYVTMRHRGTLETHGPCPEHRRSFVTVARLMKDTYQDDPQGGRCGDGLP
jgi:ribonuclease HII